MVAIPDEHDHGDGEMCKGCLFKEMLAAFFKQTRIEGRDDWYAAVGELRRSMHHALLALDNVEANPFHDADDPDDDPAANAAIAISAVGAEVDHLWELLVEPDGQGDG